MSQDSAKTINPGAMPVRAPAAVGLDAGRLARISPWMRGYVDSGRLAGASVAVMRDGYVAFRDQVGFADLDTGTAMAPDTIVRIYSMSKPITTVAALMLYEQGMFQLDDPVTRFIPAFADMQVWDGGEGGDLKTRPASRPFTIRELMNHTSGLTYGFVNATPVDAIYRERGIDFQAADRPNAELVAKLTEVPLLADPGTEWNYLLGSSVFFYCLKKIANRTLLAQ
ncbi:MAG: serine hydrolase domain-containing protein [Pseudomonadota bacterium]